MHGGGRRKKKKKHVFLVLTALQISLTLRLCEFNFLFREVPAYPLKQGACGTAVTVRRTLAAWGGGGRGDTTHNVTFPLNALHASPMAEK